MHRNPKSPTTVPNVDQAPDRRHNRQQKTRYLRFLTVLSAIGAIAAAGIAPAVTAPTAAADTDYGGGCTLYPGNREATIAALRDNCSAEQQDQIFRAASRGTVPRGVTNGWVTRPPAIEGIAPALWIGKTFNTGPDGGTLTNRITAAGTPGFPANVFTGPARLDGRDAWLLDYAPSITPQVLDEIREVTPGVWFGYSWWRGALQTPLLLTFALTEQ